MYLKIVDGRDKKYTVNKHKRSQIIEMTKLLIVPRGISAGKTVFETLSGFQWLFLLAVLTVVYFEDTTHRRYETAVLEICRKNGKTFLIAIVFLVLFFTEPKFSKLYSVAPTGMQSREIQTQIREIISSSPALEGKFIEEKYGCKISNIGFDRRNAMSSAQKWDEKYPTTEVRQHSSTLHAPTKLLQEHILEGKFRYEENRLLELNFQNARVNFDANMSMYVTKKKSSGKVDMVVALINAVYLLQKYELEEAAADWAVMI